MDIIFNFTHYRSMVEQTILAFLCIKFSENRRESFNFITNKGTKLSISIQTGKTYSSSPNTMSYEYNIYKSVEIHNGNPNWVFSKVFIKKYADNPKSPQSTVYSFVTIQDLADEIVYAINNL